MYAQLDAGDYLYEFDEMLAQTEDFDDELSGEFAQSGSGADLDSPWIWWWSGNLLKATMKATWKFREHLSLLIRDKMRPDQLIP